MEPENCDAIIWSVGCIAASCTRALFASDYLGACLLLLILLVSWFLRISNTRSGFRQGGGDGIVCGLVAIPSALAAINFPQFNMAVVFALILGLCFLLSSALIPLYDVKVWPIVALLVIGVLYSFCPPLHSIVSTSFALFVLFALMRYVPGSFTLGELFMVSTLTSLPVPIILVSTGIPRFCAMAVIAGIICLALSLTFRTPILIFLPLLPFLICFGDILDVLVFIFEPKRLLLIAYCAVVSAVFILLSRFWKGLSKFPNIIQRKFFHLMALFVLIPPVLIDASFLRLAVCIAIFAFLLIECCRLTKFPIIAPIIENYVAGFIDDRDSGGLILTHLFLLLGLGLPVVLSVGDFPGALTVKLTGIAVLAVGDAIASIVGVNFGKHKWPGTKKSLEGTFGAFIGTWLCLIISQQFAEVNFSLGNLVSLAIPSVIGALDEAFTSQIDNLTLPFVMIPFIVVSAWALC
jgi:dolichol kinase